MNLKMDAHSTPGPHGLLQIVPLATWDPYPGSGISDRWHSLNTYSVSDTIFYAVLVPKLTHHQRGNQTRKPFHQEHVNRIGNDYPIVSLSSSATCCQWMLYLVAIQSSISKMATLL